MEELMYTKLISKALLGLIFFAASSLAFCQGGTPEWIPIREILAGRKTDQLVYVEGTSGALVAEGSTTNTRLYSLRDVFGQSIRVRTSNLDFQMGRSYGVRGTVTLQGREYILVEDVRAAISRVREGGSRTEFEGKVAGKPDSGEGRTEDKPASKGGEPKAQPSKADGSKNADEESVLRNPAVLGGAAAALALVIGWVVVDRNKRRREDERRRRERELEEERIRRERELSASSKREPTAVATPGTGGSAAQAARQDTLQSWGAIKIESGPGKIAKGGFLIGAETIIGREEGQIVLHGDPLISGKAQGHGKILLSNDGRVTYVDNSTNGSKVNGKPVHHGQIELTSGDTIEMGQTVLKFESSRQSSPTPQNESPSRAPTQAFGTPSSQPTGVYTGAKLSIVAGPGVGKEFSVLQAITKIGRASGQDIELDDTTASREHCEIHVRDGKLYLKNQSKNGTTLGSTILRDEGVEAEINDGDEFQMGGTRVKVAFSGSSQT
jgi:pSer/pThr/pTyr-binding forkhead associated (FHA) protein